MSGRRSARRRSRALAWSGRRSVVALVAAFAAVAALFPALLHLPRWAEAETVLVVWWAVWVGVLGYLAYRGGRVEDDRVVAARAPRESTEGPGSSWVDAFPSIVDTGDDPLGCLLSLVAGVVVAALVAFVVGPLVELLVPLLVGGVYALVFRLISRPLRDRRARGRALAALRLAVWWATLYTAPLVVGVLAMHALLSR